LTTDYIAHHGIKGMKWGVRRYQNEDGTLTAAGKKRYERDAKENNWEIGSDGLAVGTGKKNKGTVYKPNASKWVEQDLERTKRLTDASSSMVNQLKNTPTSNQQTKKKVRMDLSNMTDKEMRDQINRALLERQYNDLFAPEVTNRGKEYANKILTGAATGLAITSSALSIALAIKQLRG